MLVDNFGHELTLLLNGIIFLCWTTTMDLRAIVMNRITKSTKKKVSKKKVVLRHSMRKVKSAFEPEGPPGQSLTPVSVAMK